MGYAVLSSEKKKGLLLNLVVAPPYRRRGIASQLVLAAAECADSLSYPALVLRVRASNDGAIALYKGLGFIDIEVRPRYYSNGEAARVMILRLPYKLPEDKEEGDKNARGLNNRKNMTKVGANNDGDDGGIPSLWGWLSGLLRW